MFQKRKCKGIFVPILRISFIFEICGALRHLVPFVQFKNVKNTHEEVLLTVYNFLNRAHGTKSGKAPHISNITCHDSLFPNSN